MVGRGQGHILGYGARQLTHVLAGDRVAGLFGTRRASQAGLATATVGYGAGNGPACSPVFAAESTDIVGCNEERVVGRHRVHLAPGLGYFLGRIEICLHGTIVIAAMHLRATEAGAGNGQVSAQQVTGLAIDLQTGARLDDKGVGQVDTGAAAQTQAALATQSVA